MAESRISLALDAGHFTVPEGTIAVYGATAPGDLADLPKAQVVAVQTSRPEYDALAAAGYAVRTDPPDHAADLSVVFLPRSKAEARATIAAAAGATNGPVVVDGLKTDGIESILRELGTRGTLSPAVSKHHGKLAVLGRGADLEDWRAAGPVEIRGGFVTRPGVFSENEIDPGSRLLADVLPDRLGARVADLGAGWGYLASRILERSSVEEMHLIEADLRALDCARLNLRDPRAVFHWADATTFHDVNGLNAVVTNPPFHRGRAGDPGLGAAFIASAARLLAPRGCLWLVANRHLPYERALAATFATVAEIGGDRSYKLIRAERPRKTKG